MQITLQLQLVKQEHLNEMAISKREKSRFFTTFNDRKICLIKSSSFGMEVNIFHGVFPKS